MGATKGIQNVRSVDATNSDNRQAIDSSGRAAIQNQPNLDVAASTLATAAHQVTLLTYVDGIEGFLASIDADTGNLDIALSALRDAIVGSGPKTLTDIEAILTTIDAVLDSIKDTDGIKKITEALPAGSNLIGKVQLRNPGDTVDLGDAANPVRIDPTDTTKQSVKLYDHNGNALSVQDGVALPANNDHLLVGGVHESDGKTYHARMRDDPDTAAIKRVMVEAMLAPGATVITTSGSPANTGQVSDFLLNATSEDMVVDGDPTPVVFTRAADGTDDTRLDSLRIVFSASFFDFDGGTFGKGGGALSTGVSVDIVANAGGFTRQLLELKVNEDFLRLLGFSISQSGSTDVLAASLPFGGNVLLKGGSSDKITVTINDDLTSGSRGISYLTATLYGEIL